jgi:arylsulfatase
MTRYRYAFKGLSPNRRMISELLKQKGYSTAAFNSNPYISRFSNYDRGFDIFVDNLPGVEGNKDFRKKILLKYVHLKALLWEPYIKAERLNKQVFDILRNVSEPYFMWIHYMDVHGPYIRKSGWDFKNTVRAGMLWRKATHSPENISIKEKEELIETYKEEIKYNDFHLGRLLSKVDQTKTVTVLTADHGELLGEHGLFAHIPHVLYDQLLKVPLIIKLPAGFPVKKRRISRPTKLLDIVPTIMDILGLERHIDFDGESLMPLIQGEPDTYKCDHVISEIWTKFLCVRRGEWKFIARYNEGKMELYNLKDDPDEHNNLSSQRQDIVVEMQKLIKKHLLKINAPPEDMEKCGFEHNDAIKTQLKALGYM